MSEVPTTARCSACGREAPRGDMFGAEPELLCEACADRVRQRMRPTPTGRMMNTLISGRTSVTLGVLVIAVVVYAMQRRWMPLLAAVGVSRDGYILATVVDQPWRLLTSAFLHGGLFHILFNGFWIWDLGRAIEVRRGPFAMALLVIGSAVVASAAQWVFAGGHDGIPYYPGGIGLSGVVYALAAFLFMQRRDDPLAAAVMSPRTTRLLAGWLVLCVILTELNVLQIGNWAHGAGALWGLAAGFANRSRFRYLWWGLLALATAGVVVLVMRGVHVW